jgi:hypothetical protein
MREGKNMGSMATLKKPPPESPSVGPRPRRCIGIAGPWKGCPCGPSRCSERPGSSCLPQRVGSASLKWHCWRGASWPIPRLRSLPCRPASGIARPGRRPAGCAASWPRGICKTCWNCHSNFAKNRHPRRTCPQASAGIADRKGLCPPSTTSHSLHDTCCYRKVEYDYSTFYREHGQRIGIAPREAQLVTSPRTCVCLS